MGGDESSPAPRPGSIDQAWHDVPRGVLLRLLHRIAEFLQKLDVAADVLVGHRVDDATVAEQLLQFGSGMRPAGAEEDVDEVENPQQLLVPAE